ncbi:MAG: hypothetical protein ACJAUP_000748 [Cellvibrionaceae bacterium]|jgi:hypothetical protein
MSSKAETKSGPQISVPSISGANSSQDFGTGPKLFLYILIALEIFTGATYFELNQDPKPNAYSKPTPRGNCYYPKEKMPLCICQLLMATLMIFSCCQRTKNIGGERKSFNSQ